MVWSVKISVEVTTISVGMKHARCSNATPAKIFYSGAIEYNGPTILQGRSQEFWKGVGSGCRAKCTKFHLSMAARRTANIFEYILSIFTLFVITLNMDIH